MRRVLRSIAFITACWLLCGNSDLFARHRHCNCYSYGSYGSSGGSGGNYRNGNTSGYSNGYYANNNVQPKVQHSYASYGSTGGSPAYRQQPVAPQQRVAATRPVQPQSHKVTLELTVPEAAQVYLVNQRMSLVGTTRRFVIPISDATKSYQYPIRIELTANGQKSEAATSVKIRAGMYVKINVLGDGKQQVSTVSQL